MDRKFQTVSASSDVRNDQNTGFEECHDCNMNQTLQKLKHHSKMCLHNAPATDARARSKRSLFKPCCAHINHVNKNTKADDDELLSHTVFSTQETAVGGQLEDKNVEEKLEIASSMTNDPWARSGVAVAFLRLEVFLVLLFLSFVQFAQFLQRRFGQLIALSIMGRHALMSITHAKTTT